MKHLQLYQEFINESQVPYPLPSNVKEYTDNKEYKRALEGKPNGKYSSEDAKFINNLIDITPLKYYPYPNIYRYWLGTYSKEQLGVHEEYTICKDYKKSAGRDIVFPAAVFSKIGNGTYSLSTYAGTVEDTVVKYYTAPSLEKLLPLFAAHFAPVILKTFKWIKIK